MTGCEGRDSFVEELEIAEQNTHKQKSITSEEVNVAASHVAQKYFPLGMKKTELLKVLNEFYKNGYEVLELKQEGTRLWPSKEFRRYPNVNRQKNILQVQRVMFLKNSTILRIFLLLKQQLSQLN